jgi:acyl-CoA thioesterase-1
MQSGPVDIQFVKCARTVAHPGVKRGAAESTSLGKRYCATGVCSGSAETFARKQFECSPVFKKFRKNIIGLTLALLSTLAAGGAYSAPKTVLVLGDSLSAEYGLVRGKGWVALLQQRLIDQKIDATVINASISGDTTSGGKARLAPLLSAHRPDVVVVELGSNDALRGLPLSETENNLNAILSAAKDNKARTLLIGMQIPPNYGTTYTRQFSQLFGKVARARKSALAPFLLEGVAQQPALFQADRLHPNEQAQATLLDNVWPHLKPLLQK